MLTTAEVADTAGLELATRVNWREDGSVEHAFAKFGSCVRYRYAGVAAFAERARCTSKLAARKLAVRQSVRER